ncbi:MAG: hypothetical protein K9G67_12335 [Bacteroidales bacterium]|nr:hypothetical protein [Bacteroidales bacterium]MCF8345197.1 hypothetical protein [Bacteroidales bacterium]MCF8352415.1 hypothetical protein [Bacteroidales bacterium]MCF8377137.1 hypothetical protein [Bacteroidales bacterium]MCF8401043.1 hypothetical protein [Bacteroidales bacterium]
MKQLIIKILLTVVIIFLAYLVVDSIRKPVEFKKNKQQREQVVIKRLIDIRNGQQLYKNFNGKYMGSWDTLIDFLQTAEIPIVKITQDPEDTTMTVKIRDTIGYMNAADSIYHKRFKVSNIKYIPFTEDKIFDMDAGIISKGSVKVPVFEAKAHYNDILNGLDEQLVLNLVEERKALDKYPGLKVGSMSEPSTDGNWELK